ncbi:MAG: hypothetical protein J6J11_02300 [Treponema sp.]|nr:hypothetical protein [Treponema sp.]MBQ7882632.1 hypothetical protein [Treponema sp.]
MLSKITKGYKQLIFSVSKIVFLLSLCVLIGIAFVFPLWKFATELPKTYTVTILSVMGAIFIYILTKKIINTGLKESLITLLKIFIICLGVYGCVQVVLIGKRILIIPIIIAMILLYGIISFGFKDNTKITTKIYDSSKE